jgi:hypothetical protein
MTERTALALADGERATGPGQPPGGLTVATRLEART